MKLILIRYGEIALKSHRTRPRMERLLVNNIVDALKSIGVDKCKIWVTDARVFVKVPDENLDDSIEVLSRVFGIVSLSPVIERKFKNLDDIVKYGLEIFKDKVKDKIFMVRARRAGEHDFTSKDIEKALGKALLESGAKGVNLENPEVVVYVEVRYNRAYFYDEVIKGPGGLPIGSEGVVLSLISGGFDSAVASWYMLKRGAIVHYVFFNLGGKEHEAGVIRVAKILADYWSYGYKPILYVIDFRPVVADIMGNVGEEIWNVMLRRLMFRAAEKLALKIGAEALVTGESLGQVSSQTLRNIAVAEEPVKIPIFRPLIGMDKDEIVKMARIIGTYEESAKLQEYCAIVSAKPTTKADPEIVRREEEKLNLNILEALVENAKVINLKEITIPEVKFRGRTCRIRRV